MTLEIDPNLARDRIDDFLEQIETLLEKPYDEGREQKRTMSRKLDNFAEFAFENGEKRKESLHVSVMSAPLVEKSHEEKQKHYEKSLKRKRINLKAWKDQIKIEKGTESDDIPENETYKEIEAEISEIKQKLPLYANNLEQSVEELRNGHHLASVMITGRVIDCTVDQIQSSQNLAGLEEVLDHLEENGMIDSREGTITDSVKLYRDVYSHDVGKSPGLIQTIIILLGCAKLLHRIQDEGKSRKYDLA